MTTSSKGWDAGGFNRILVAYDGSARAQDALSLALRLLEPSSGSLTLACVGVRRSALDRLAHGDSGPNPDEGADGVEAMLTEARHAVEPGIHVRMRELLAASPARGLTELAESEEADLVVVGSSRHAALGGVATERTAGRLLHGAPCAVAIAPAGHRGDGPFRHIGVAFDGSSEARAAVMASYGLAARDGAAVTLVRALPSIAASPLSGGAGEGEQRLERHAAQEELDEVSDAAPEGVNPRTVLLHGAPEVVIKETCDGVVDLLITGSRGYGPLRRALLGSVSEVLVEGAPHPVILIPRTPAPSKNSVDIETSVAAAGLGVRTPATPSTRPLETI